jgi:hypothetical protein
MSLSFSRRCFVSTLLWLTLLLPASSHAQSNPPIYSPVLLGNYWNDATNGIATPIQARPSGGTATVQNLLFGSNDFSRNVFGSGRYFLRIEGFSGIPNLHQLVAYDETGTQRIPLTSQTDNLYVWRVRWSPDGNQIAWIGGIVSDPTNPNSPGTYGVFVGEVTRDSSGNPTAVANIRPLVTRPKEQVIQNPATISWTGDKQYLVYAVYNVYVHLYRVSVAADGSAPQEQEIHVGNVAQSGSTLLYIKASPASGDNRIAFQVRGSRGNLAAYDIWTVAVPAGYAGQSLTALQVTSKSNVKYAPKAGDYDWSPDGGQFALSATGGTMLRVEKVASTGAGSSSVLLSASNTAYSLSMWRD